MWAYHVKVVYVLAAMLRQSHVATVLPSLQSRWLPLIQTLVYMYPIVTLMVMVVLSLEITIKKFMYYRLLSMRVLIDWENYMVSR